MVLPSGATPVHVRLQPAAFDLGIDAIGAALGPRTRAVIVNTTHNPTGRIYSLAALERLADKRAKAAVEYGSPIWIIPTKGTAALCSTVVDFSVRSLPSVFAACSHLPQERAGTRATARFPGLAPSLPEAEVCAGHCSA